uniref:CUE domain-containing protein n=1 Tax=Monodelphis domestica TaxID=13616 RepID=F6WZS5_MONDO
MRTLGFTGMGSEWRTECLPDPWPHFLLSGTVCDMMFDVSSQLSDARNKENVCPESQEDNAPASPELLQSLEEGTQEIRKSQAHTSAPLLGGGKKTEEVSETDELQAGIQLLLEMFPSCTLGRAQRALAMARGDLEEAVQIMVEEKVEPQALGNSSKVYATASPHPNTGQKWFPRLLIRASFPHRLVVEWDLK